MMLDKKQIRMTFLLAFKISHKEVQTACNNVFGPVPAAGIEVFSVSHQLAVHTSQM